MQKSPTFGTATVHTRNILTRLLQKSPTFGNSYSTINILTRLLQKSPTFGNSYSTRNILTRLLQKSPTFVDAKVDEFVTHTVKFATFEPPTSTERLSTVSSPYMVYIYLLLFFIQHLYFYLLGDVWRLLQLLYFWLHRGTRKITVVRIYFKTIDALYTYAQICCENVISIRKTRWHFSTSRLLILYFSDIV